jgi:hypothetical protein
MILVSRAFQKQLEKIWSIKREDVLRAIEKHSQWLENFIILFEHDGIEILKGYLLGKRVRLVVAFARKWNNYFPILVVRKESKVGYNITKYDESMLLSELRKHIECIEKWEYETYPL